MTHSGTSAQLGLLLSLYGLAFGLGTNLLYEWYYPIRGIGLLDFVLVAHFVLLVASGEKHYALTVLRPETARISFLILVFAGWLLLATLANASKYSLEARDILAVLRLIYFIVLIMHISRHVEKHGFAHLLVGYVVGVAIVFYQDFSTLTEENEMKTGIRVLGNPNVIGAQLGLVVYFCSLAVIAGREKLFLPVALIFSALSIMTFSKGTWILIALGLTANLLALYMRQRDTVTAPRPVWLYVCSFVGAAGAALFFFWDIVVTVLRFKLASTEDLGTFETRQSLLVAGLSAGLEHPLFGLGFGNFYKVVGLYPELPLPELEREDNAHNLFGQIAAVGGMPALCALILIMIFGFRLLHRVLRERVEGSPFTKLAYVALSVAVFCLFASVQLQLIAQPTFWFYCAVLIGWAHSRRRGATLCGRPDLDGHERISILAH
jgi:O-antigen ligase